MTVDPAKVPAGTQLSGVLVGSIDGEPVTRTALGTIAEAERYDLTITATDFDGNATTAYAMLYDPATQWAEPVLVDGETTLRLMKGDYTVMSFMELARTPDTIATVLVGEPTLELDQNRTVALDARAAEQITVDVGQDGLDPVFRRMDVTVDDFVASAMMPVWTDEMWAQPQTVDDADFGFTTRWRLQTPLLTLKVGKQPLDLIEQIGSTLLDGSFKATAADAGKGSAEEFAAADVAGKIAVVTRSAEVSASQRAANAAAAGAKLLIVVNDGDGEFNEWVGSEDYTTDVGIPVAGISGVEGRQLLAQLATKKTTIAAVGVPTSDVVYDIAEFGDGEIPSDLSYVHTEDDLARIDTRFHGQTEEIGEFRYDFVPGAEYGSGFPMRTQRGTERAEWVNTDGLRWYQSLGITSVRWEMRDIMRTYEPGERTEAEYYGGIVRPYVGTGYWVPNLVSDYAQINIPSWADGGDSAHTGAFDTWSEPSTVQQLTDVYLDGQLIRQTEHQGANVFDLPDGEHDWRVVSTATHDGSHLAGSTKTVSDWTFRATGKLGDWEYRLLPLIQAYYDVDVNAKNLVGEGRKKGSGVTLGLELGHVAGTAPAGAITDATLEARTAGGDWVPVALASAETDAPTGAVEHDGGIFVESRAWVSGFSAQIPVPDKGGWVDLRVTATDAEGNTFSQEIERAFEATPGQGRPLTQSAPRRAPTHPRRSPSCCRPRHGRGLFPRSLPGRRPLTTASRSRCGEQVLRRRCRNRAARTTSRRSPRRGAGSRAPGGWRRRRRSGAGRSPRCARGGSSRLYGDRSPCAKPAPANASRMPTTWAKASCSSSPCSLLCASRGAAARPSPTNSMSTSVSLTCTGYGTGTPACQARHSAANSLSAQCPAATERPCADLRATARASRVLRIVRPSS